MKTFSTLRKTVLFFAFAFFAIISRAQTASVNTEKNSCRLVAFTATLNNNRVDVKFTTELENNLSHIVVERSTDGINFNDAGLVFTYGNTTNRSDYALPDNISKLNATTIFYRLKIVNGDGTVTYSNIRTVKPSGGTNIIVG